MGIKCTGQTSLSRTTPRQDTTALISGNRSRRVDTTSSAPGPPKRSLMPTTVSVPATEDSRPPLSSGLESLTLVSSSTNANIRQRNSGSQRHQTAQQREERPNEAEVIRAENGVLRMKCPGSDRSQKDHHPCSDQSSYGRPRFTLNKQTYGPHNKQRRNNVDRHVQPRFPPQDSTPRHVHHRETQAQGYHTEYYSQTEEAPCPVSTTTILLPIPPSQSTNQKTETANRRTYGPQQTG